MQPLGMLVCSKEQRLILTADVLRHLQHTHKVNLSRNVLANISAEISEHEPADVGWCTSYYDDRLASLANRNASTALPIWNVDIKPASVCLVPSCGFVTPKTRSDWTIKEHMTKRHPSYWSNLPNNARWRDGHCQAMSGQRDPGGAIYISVTITTADLPTLNLPVLPGTCLPNCPPAGRPTPAGFLCPIGASFDPAISMVDPLCIHLEVVRRSARPGGHLSGAVGKGVKMRPKRRFSPTNSPLLRLDHPDGQTGVELYS